MKDYRNIFDLTGKVAIVTGAAQGFGLEVSRIYTQYGAAVVMVDINEAMLKEAVDSIAAEGGKVAAKPCDVSKSAQVKRVVDETITEFGRVDIMFNNAGIGRRSKAEEMTDEDFDIVIDVNLKSMFYFCREVGRHMIARGEGGHIINMSSIVGVVGVTTGNANYSASKGGIIAMTRCLAIEWAEHGILVNAIAPTHMRTAIIEKLMKENPAKEAYFLSNIPLGRLGCVDDIVGPALFLASDASQFVTGHVLLVDGGHTAK